MVPGDKQQGQIGIGSALTQMDNCKCVFMFVNCIKHLSASTGTDWVGAGRRDRWKFRKANTIHIINCPIEVHFSI